MEHRAQTAGVVTVLLMKDFSVVLCLSRILPPQSFDKKIYFSKKKLGKTIIFMFSALIIHWCFFGLFFDCNLGHSDFLKIIFFGCIIDVVMLGCSFPA